MAQKYTAREYAESMEKQFGANAKVTWMTIRELMELYDLVYEDRVQDDLEREADEKDLRDTNRSIISTFLPY